MTLLDNAIAGAAYGMKTVVAVGYLGTTVGLGFVGYNRLPDPNGIVWLAIALLLGLLGWLAVSIVRDYRARGYT